MRRVAFAAVLAALAASVSAAPPETFPGLGDEGTRDAFAVVRFEPGAYLPPFPECAGGDAICMDPPPFWLATHVESTVAGTLPERLDVATTSHYGMERFGLAPRAYFAWIRSDGRAYQMPRYAMAFVVRGADGGWMIPMAGELPGWLPCEAATRRIAVDAATLPADIAVPRDSDRHAEALASGLYVDTAHGAMPRYAIPVAALADLLPTQGHRFREQDCPSGT